MANVNDKSVKKFVPNEQMTEAQWFGAIGRRLKNIFPDKKAEELAEQINGYNEISGRSLRRYFKGELFPSSDVLLAVHRRGWSINWLLFGIGEQSLAAQELLDVKLAKEEELIDLLSSVPDHLLFEAIRRKPERQNPVAEHLKG